MNIKGKSALKNCLFGVLQSGVILAVLITLKKLHVIHWPMICIFIISFYNWLGGMAIGLIGLSVYCIMVIKDYLIDRYKIYRFWKNREE